MDTSLPTVTNLPVAAAPPDARTFWQKVAATLARIPFAEDLVAAWYCANDRDTPAYVRGVLLGALGYFVLPADMVPDILAVVGFSDDAAVIAAAVAAVGRHMTPAHRRQARERLAALAGTARPG